MPMLFVVNFASLLCIFDLHDTIVVLAKIGVKSPVYTVDRFANRFTCKQHYSRFLEYPMIVSLWDEPLPLSHKRKWRYLKWD